MNHRLSVAIVICTASHERKALLRTCIDSVLGGARVPEELFLVVDQNPGLRAELAQSLPAAVALLQTERRGLSEARTVGIRSATSDVVVFVDDDVEVERDWLASLVEPFEASDQALGVGGTIVPRWDGDGSWLPEELLWLVGCTYRGHRRDPGPVRNPIGANMAFRRKELLAIGGFAPEFGKQGNALAVCEETELSLRIERAHGPGRIHYAPEALVHHLLSAERLSSRALFVRCIAEGLSKGRLHRLHGGSALSSEQGYARVLLGEALPRLILSAFRKRDLRPLKGAGAILAALVLTGAAFVVGLAGGGTRGESSRRSRNARALARGESESRVTPVRTPRVPWRARPNGRVRVSSPAPRDLWEETLASDPNALVSQTPAWIDCICAFGGHEDASRLYELPGGRRLVLPMVRRRHLPGPLSWEASLPPHWETGGILAPAAIQSEDLRVVFSDLVSRTVVRTSLRPSPLDAKAWAAARPSGTVAVPRLAHVLELDGGFGKVWAERFRGEARTAIRKAERSGLTVERDASGKLIPILHELFERSLDRWAHQQHEPRALARWRGLHRDSMRKFELIARSLGEACRIWVAWRDGQPAAAILVLQGTNASYIRGMMNKELAGPSRANDLLQKLAIEEACDAGCRFYHMGESGSSAALSRFKTKFGARPYPYAEYHIERLPITALDRQARGIVKQVLGFRD